jgi:hypothetical protein
MVNMNEKKSLFAKVGDLASYTLDGLLVKAKKVSEGGGSGNFMTLKRKAVYVDDTFITNQGIFQEKTSIIPFDILRQVAERDMAALSVINKIVNRVSAFSRPQKDRFSMGYVFTKKNKKEEMSDIDDKEVEELYKFFEFTGYTEGREREDIRNFDTFLRLIVWDALVYNQIGIECIPQKGNESELAYFTPVPGSSVRRAMPDLKSRISSLDGLIFNLDRTTERNKLITKMEKEDLGEIKYVQVYKQQVLAVFTEDELIYKFRRPSLEISCQGYPVGELEFLINTIANHRTAEIHNEVYFKQGHSSNGILNIKEEMTEEDLQGVKRLFQRQATGVRNAHRQLIMAAPKGIEYIPMSSLSNKDMEWHEWMMYLIKLICSVFGVNPAEINFDISKDSAQSLGDGGKRNEVQLRDTRNSMLRPLLNWIEDVINNDLLPKYSSELSDKYIFEFVGLDALDEDQELDRIKKKVTTVYTVNEVRRELGMDDLENGDIILDNVFIQNKSSVEMQAQQEQMGGDMFEGDVDLFGNEEKDPLENEEDRVAEEETGVEETMFDENQAKAEKSLRKSIEKKGLKRLKAKPIKIEWFK